MKKLIAFFSSMLVLAGLKAQTLPVKKETVNADTVKQVKAVAGTGQNAASTKAFKEFKNSTIKKANAADMKELKVTSKEHIKY